MTDDLPEFVPFDVVEGAPGLVTRADVVAAARSHIGVKYAHQGRTRHGLDCVGLVIAVARELSLVAPDFDINGYSPTPDGKELLVSCDRYMTRIGMHLVQPGDVLVYQFKAGLGPQHMGVVGDYLYGGLSMIQALCMTDGSGEVVEWNISRPRKNWKPVQAYKLPGIV